MKIATTVQDAEKSYDIRIIDADITSLECIGLCNLDTDERPLRQMEQRKVYRDCSIVRTDMLVLVGSGIGTLYTGEET
jgi:hypothetical protein